MYSFKRNRVKIGQANGGDICVIIVGIILSMLIESFF